ncbi:MAG TPA: glycosyl transferase [Rhodobacteraceae bacterium]|jgi:cellulose synthase/poly-beta-1,6-N-acetylglucosamine synthase-like glycosyltransferase|nr:glycosyl transferase [Paracoccaceae bacterium]HBV53663.1 glycosyl transferase [Paracoccaceae bacterium]
MAKDFSSNRNFPTPGPRNGGTASDLAAFLANQGLLDKGVALALRATSRRSAATLCEIIRATGLVAPTTLIEADAEYRGLPRADLCQIPAPQSLAILCDASVWLRHCAVPWCDASGKLHIAMRNPDSLEALLGVLPPNFSTAQPALALEEEIQEALAAIFHDILRDRASARVPEKESCRTWGRRPKRRAVLLTLFGTAFLSTLVFWPTIVLSALVLWAIFAMILSALQKVSALFAHLTRPLAPPRPLPVLFKKPKISVLVPLFREQEVAQVLVRRLERLTYPKHLLDVILVLEETDIVTQNALESAELPPWMRKIIVPDGQPRTKPRAMNYALDFCRGDIIGIWDAEDAPEPQQLDVVAETFRCAPPDTVCLQGILDFYNPKQNWLARCFTIEYATWFRTILPGLTRLGFAIPLGGTTLFFRREALEVLGGWDAHNVTEDADLGFRLARHGYNTEMIPVATDEEANCHTWPWIKQRSRWLKGYMVTYIVAMRDPIELWSQLGAWKFLGLQAHFITSLSQFLLAPLLWSFWLIMLGYAHPLESVVPREWLMTMGILFLGFECITVGAGAVSVSGPKHRHLLPWVPTLHLYFPLATIAAYKALWELVFSPFYWDKTTHGLSLSKTASQSSPQGPSLNALQDT